MVQSRTPVETSPACPDQSMRARNMACADWKGSMLVLCLVILAWAAAARGQLRSHLVRDFGSACEWHRCQQPRHKQARTVRALPGLVTPTQRRTC